METNLKIKEIEIQSLFGYLNHKIPLKKDDRITIIHGPNGVGKTTILRLVSDLFKRQFLSLFVTPFDRIVIRFKPKGSLTVIRTKEKKQKDPNFVKLKLIYQLGKKRTEHTMSSPEVVRILGKYPTGFLENIIDNIERVGPSEWYDERTDRRISLAEVILSYGHLLPSAIRESIILIPKEIESLLKQTNIVVVETQRLFTRYKDENEELVHRYRRRIPVQQRMTVEQYSDDMVSQIEKYQRKSGEIGADLDGSFPQRLLLESELPKEATENHIRKEYSDQSEYRDRLMASGLLTAQTPEPLLAENLADSERKVLWVYLKDVKSKLRVFDWLLHRVELFKDIVNSRFSYKKFKVDREMGFIFESNHDGSIVSPGALSSGEQHEIVLTYELLFRASAGSLIFIDEPELSLHVTWQRRFLDDIAKISELADLDFLVATHSPSIINNRRDLMVKLAGKEENEHYESDR